MEPDVILGKATLMELALADPQTPEDLAGIEALDAWERQRYGAALLEVLTTTVVPEL
jgi:hypothetical protein